MALFPSCSTLLCAVLLLLFSTTLSAQYIAPSNDTAEVPPYESSPRFWINGTDFESFRVVPLSWYARISQSHFLSIQIEGRLVYVNATNIEEPGSDGILYVSCDPEDYGGGDPSDVLRSAGSRNPGCPIVIYSTRANHCTASNLRSMMLSSANGVFSTLDPVLARTVVSEIRNSSQGVPANVMPDTSAYSNTNGGYGSNDRGPGPTTAVAMIILYTITGLITALFIVIIVTGAVRAHRHPERYGPSNVVGRPRRSRAKGIARAMLDTIPIVKFGEKDDAAKKEENDVELATVASTKDADKTKDADVAKTEPAAGSNADGTDETGQLGCSICTEDFNKGEEVRVLPCNHKFHPECVDPWLLNVSGTCPLCRIDLRPKEEQEAANGTATADAATVQGEAAPPLGERRGSYAGRRDSVAFAGLMSVASASREDRIAALRRFRQQRRNRAGQTEAAEQQDEDRRGVSARLRERFRVRTRRQGEDAVEETRLANPPTA